MRRRSLLQQLSGGIATSLGAGLLAGCVGSPTPPEADEPTGAELPGSTSAPTPTPTPDSCVPSWVDHHTYCADDPAAPFSITVAPSEPSLPKATIEATVTAPSDASLSGGRNNYSLEKWSADRWARVVPHGGGTDMGTLEPEESWSWSIDVDNSHLELPRPRDDSPGLNLRLGPGAYSFTYTGGLGTPGTATEAETEVGRRIATVGRTFTVSGEDLSVVPTKYVSDVRREGDTVYVTSKRPRLREYGARRATLIVARDDTPAPSLDRFDRLLTEDLYNGFPEPFTIPLRNAISHFENGVNTVRVTTDARVVPVFGVDPPKIVGVDNRTYRLDTKDPEREDSSGPKTVTVGG